MIIKLLSKFGINGISTADMTNLPLPASRYVPKIAMVWGESPQGILSEG
jgi:hypothetical protein